MKSKIKRPITSSSDGDREISEVRLATGEVVRLLSEDQRRLQELGVMPNWTFNNNGGRCNYVCGWFRKTGRGSMIRIARLVSRAQAGQIVRYRDGDSLNLLPENLRLQSGRSFGRELAVFQP